MLGRRKLTLLYFVSSLALSASAQAEPIASVHDVVNNATHTPPGASVMPVHLNDALVQNEAVETAPQSAVQMVFIDGSELRLEESSKIVLDNYVFDPHAQASNGLVNLGAGIFRFTSNGKNDQGVILKSPAATIGVRGTDIVINVQQKGVTRVDVLDGKVFIKPLGSGSGAEVAAGQSGLVTDPNMDAAVGDIGSFSTAAGAPASPAAGPKAPNGHNDDHGGSTANQGSSGGSAGNGSEGGSGGSGGGSGGSSGGSGGGDGGSSGGGSSGGDGGDHHHHGGGDGDGDHGGDDGDGHPGDGDHDGGDGHPGDGDHGGGHNSHDGDHHHGHS